MLKTIEKALLLQELDILRFASADHLMQLAETGREEIHHKGDHLLRAGEPALTCYLLLAGQVSTEGTDKKILDKGAVNMNDCLSGGSSRSNIVCVEDCTVLAIDRSELLDLLTGEAELAIALLRHYASKEIDQS